MVGLEGSGVQPARTLVYRPSQGDARLRAIRAAAHRGTHPIRLTGIDAEYLRSTAALHRLGKHLLHER